MKPRPLVFAALVCVAVFVSSEFPVAARRTASVGNVLSARVHASAAATVTVLVMKVLARSLQCPAKS
jgi:hypothetical protein